MLNFYFEILLDSAWWSPLAEFYFPLLPLCSFASLFKLGSALSSKLAPESLSCLCRDSFGILLCCSALYNCTVRAFWGCVMAGLLRKFLKFVERSLDREPLLGAGTEWILLGSAILRRLSRFKFCVEVDGLCKWRYSLECASIGSELAFRCRKRNQGCGGDSGVMIERHEKWSVVSWCTIRDIR